MLILLALLQRLAPLLPQSLRAFAERQAVRYIQRRIASASPRDAAFMNRLCDALVNAAETDAEIVAAIRFASCTQATLLDRDRSGHFNPRRPRRTGFTRRNERARLSSKTPDATLPRALDLSG